MTSQNPIKNIDYILLAAIVLIAAFGIATLYSATYGVSSAVNYPARQAVWTGIGFVLMFAAILIDYRHFLRLAYLFYFFNLAALLLVSLHGRTVGGAQRWLSVGGFMLQPSEFIKPVLVLAIAKFFSNREEQAKSVKCLLAASVLVLIPMVLVIQQPDLGTALMLMPLFLALVYAAGVPGKYLASIIAGGIALMPLFWFILKDYQKSRLLVFLNPDIDPLGAGYSINQSRIAIGSGGFSGRGWLSGTQTQLSFLPENRTDFVFSTVGEEFGFIGAFFIIALYTFVIMRGLRIAREAKDTGAVLVAVGVSIMLLLHMFVNIGMATGMLPVVGMPLPLLSYGGSATVSSLAAVGLLINIRSRRFKY